MRLRVLTAVVYVVLAFLAVATIAPETRLALAALVYRFSYLPDLTLPGLWLGLALGVTIVIADAARRMAAARKVGLGRYAVILLLTGIAFGARRNVTTPARPSVQDGVAHLVARVELAMDTAYDRDKQYTDDVAALTHAWPDELRDLGYYRRGAWLLRSHLVVVHDAAGPALAPTDETAPGDVVVALSDNHKSYWITSFGLDHAGRVVPLVDERARAIVASATNGRVASRLDPLFPEYPHKSESQHPPH